MRTADDLTYARMKNLEFQRNHLDRPEVARLEEEIREIVLANDQLIDQNARLTKQVEELRRIRTSGNETIFAGLPPARRGLQVRCKRIIKHAKIPCQANPEDAGWDLFAAKDYVIGPGHTVGIRTGLAFEIPPGYYGQIFGRSSVSKLGLVILGGVMDSGYRGDWTVIVHNLLQSPIRVYLGDAVGEVVFLPVQEVDMIPADELSESARGAGGFGTSGNVPSRDVDIS